MFLVRRNEKVEDAFHGIEQHTPLAMFLPADVPLSLIDLTEWRDNAVLNWTGYIFIEAESSTIRP